MIGLAAALAFEALVVLLLLTLGTRRTVPMADEGTLSTFDVSAVPEPAPEAEPERRADAPAPTAPAAPVTPPPPSPVPPAPRASSPIPPAAVPMPSPLVTLPPGQMAESDLRNRPAPAPRAPAGPPAPRGGGDSEVVGRAPNGETLYAAAWLREPYDSELRGYLSTADPGWALIACKTVPDFRVDECVAIDEWPNGSRLARAVLAAAWQFKVRPPRVGGSYRVGEWVRIRIDYSVRRGP